MSKKHQTIISVELREAAESVVCCQESLISDCQDCLCKILVIYLAGLNIASELGRSIEALLSCGDQ